MSATVTGTFLFTDLVGSTALSSRLDRDAGEAVRAAHFALLRGALGASGGIEVKNLGDGVMAYFPSTTRALACAVSIQQALERHNRRADHPLAVRIGVAMGDAVEEDGDYFGDPVVEAARLCAAADAGQILTTDVVRLVVGRHVTHELVPIGALDLRGIPDPVEAVAVQWEPSADAKGADGQPVPLPAQLVSEGGRSLFAFFGRADELAVIGQAIKGAGTESRLHAVLIGGEPGIGKSTLVAQASRAAHGEGATVLYGGCAEELVVSYRPWIAALTHLVTSRPEVAGSLAPVHAGALARMLPTLADRFPSTTHGASDPGSERYLLMEAVVAVLAEASEETDVVVVLDDLHWADDASVHLLRHLIGSATAMRVAVLGTYRSSELRRGSPLTGIVAESHQETRVARVDLAGLADAEIAALIESAAGHDIGDEGVVLAEALHRETDGNAFFVTELLRHLAESGGLAADDDGRYRLAEGVDGLALPQSVREVIGQRVARLGDDVARVLSLAAVIGVEFDLDVLAEVADIDEDRLLDLLELVAAAAIVAETATPGRYRFGHALVQHTLIEDLSATRRQRAHRRIAEALEGRAGSTAAELARHWIAATEPANQQKAVTYAEGAGDAAMDALAPSDAADWYQQALELLERDPQASERSVGRLLVRLAAALSAAGRPGDQEPVFRRAAALARRLGDPELIVAAALSPTPGSLGYEPADAERLAALEAALDVVGSRDSPERARLLALLAEEMDPLDWRGRHEVAAEAFSMGERLDDPATFMGVVMATCSITASPDTLPRRLESLKRVRAMVDRSRVSPTIRSNVLHSLGQALLESGDLDGFDEHRREHVELAQGTGLPMIVATAASATSFRALLRGDTEAAEEAAERSLHMHGVAAHPAGPGAYGVLLENVRIVQGRAAEIVELFEDAAAAAEVMPSFDVELTRLYREVGDVDRGADRFDGLVARGLEDCVPRDGMWFIATVNLANAAVWLDRRETAATLHQVLLPHADLIPCTQLNWAGTPHETLAATAALLGQVEESELHHERAVALYRRFETPYWLAQALIAHAERLRSWGRPSDDGLGEAAAMAERYGFAGLTRRVAGLSGG
jgi:class 3 adenylate cyclase/tetratricopeptide (TPR) repeat protein